MTTSYLTNPVGHYKPELLLLAPESGEDLNTLSLVSQFLELGVAIELDKNWRLPTVPPKDLSAYKACLFPESARERYDTDLDAFNQKGGYLGYFKYYPVHAQTPEIPGVHHYYSSFGRDDYFFSVANVMLECGLTLNQPDFIRTLQSRSVNSMIAEYRNTVFKKYGSRNITQWKNWSDPAYTFFLNNLTLSKKLEDNEWKNLTNYCLTKLCEASDEASKGTFSDSNQLADKVCITQPMMAELLMDYGKKTNQNHFIDAGIKLVKFFAQNADQVDGVISAKYMRLFWSESIIPCPGLYWAYRMTNDKKYLLLADTLIRKVSERNHRPDGIWWHWSNSKGDKGACWSCGTGWCLLFMTQSLMGLDPASSSAEFIRKELIKTYDGLAKFQNAEKGIWHLVIDEPETRVETRGSALILYSYDRLREMNVLPSKHDEMMDRAFEGFKTLNYNGGVAATCRGTATGVANYYRTRPMGWYGNSLFPGAMAVRRDKVESKPQLHVMELKSD